MSGASGFFRSRVALTLCVIAAILLVAALFVPVLDVNKRQHANEAVAVVRLRKLGVLQGAHAASHPARGFACQLSELKPSMPIGNSYDPDEFLLTGVQAGYKFAVTKCRTNANGAVTQYEATAVPVERGSTGFYAFCTDQSGTIWYDSDGSGERCLTSRRLLQ
jgi:hypothetical protein